MRLFIAVEMPLEITGELEKIKGYFSHIKSVKPVSRDNLHITMKFLGEIADSKVAGIAEALKAVKFKPFKLHLNEAGVFPNEKYLGVIWVDSKPDEELLALNEKISLALPSFKDSHEFKSHMTIARVKFPTEQDKEEILKAINQVKVEQKEFTVTSFALYKSTLTPKGPVYEAIERYSCIEN